MLTRYCGDYAEGAAPIRHAIASGDLALAHLLAHNLRRCRHGRRHCRVWPGKPA
jgi:hypothetical protein